MILTNLQKSIVSMAYRRLKKKSWFRGYVSLDEFKNMTDDDIRLIGKEFSVRAVMWDTQFWDDWA